MTKRDELNVDEFELVQEVHDRLDVLIKLLDEKGIVSEKEYLNNMQDYLEKKYQ